MKALYILILQFILFSAAAQQHNATFSAPIDLPQTGWNKVLCMNNGNTLLLHLEPQKAITIIVYDSSHKEIARQKHWCDTLNVNMLERSVFKGFYDINGEATLFIQQPVINKKGLVRVRFNETNGKIIEERVLAVTNKINEKTIFYVTPNQDNKGYSVFCLSDIFTFKECELKLLRFNEKHELVADIPIDVDNRKKYDYIGMLGMTSLPTGLSISLGLSKIVTNPTTRANMYGAPAIKDNFVFTIYLPNGTNTPDTDIVNVSQDVHPYFSNTTYNPFAQSMNLLLLNYLPLFQKNGLQYVPVSDISHLFLKYDLNGSNIAYSWIKNDSANEKAHQKTKNDKIYDGIPIAMFTNKNGLTTIIYEEYHKYRDVDPGRRVAETFLGNIIITQTNDNGGEIWGSILPKEQYSKGFKNYLAPEYLGNKKSDDPIFNDLLPEVYERQFTSLNAYTNNGAFYMVYNDNNSNFAKGIQDATDTVYDYDYTNTVYYKVASDKTISKKYLFGKPGTDQSESSFIEGADYDKNRNTYATLMLNRKAKKTTMQMAWCHFE